MKTIQWNCSAQAARRKRIFFTARDSRAEFCGPAGPKGNEEFFGPAGRREGKCKGTEKRKGQGKRIPASESEPDRERGKRKWGQAENINGDKRKDEKWGQAKRGSGGRAREASPRGMVRGGGAPPFGRGKGRGPGRKKEEERESAGKDLGGKRLGRFFPRLPAADPRRASPPFARGRSPRASRPLP